MRAAQCTLGWLLMVYTSAYAQELVQTPSETKALYTKYIAEYTTWPPTAAAPQTAPDKDPKTDPKTAPKPFVIGIVGDDPNGVMEPMRRRIGSAKGVTIKERPIELKDVSGISTVRSEQHLDAVLAGCSLLFFSEDSHAQWVQIEPLLRGRPVLTIGEMPGFANRGGMVEYQYDQAARKMYMVFNMRKLKEAGLVVSGNLLTLQISRPLDQDNAE